MCRGRISHPSYPRHSKYYGPWAVRINNNNKKKSILQAEATVEAMESTQRGRVIQSQPLKQHWGSGLTQGFGWEGDPCFQQSVGKLQYGKTVTVWGRKSDMKCGVQNNATNLRCQVSEQKLICSSHPLVRQVCVLSDH